MGYLGKQITITGTQNSRRLSVLATDGQTTFTVSNGYTIGQLDVYRNGVKLNRARDFTASDGTSVILVNAASANDIVEFVVFENFDVTDAITTGGNQTITGDLTVEGDFTAGTALTVTNGGVTAGILTAQSFHGDGTNLTNVGVDTAQVSTSGLVVAGVSTLAGITSVTGSTLFAKQLNISGVSTFNAVRIGDGGDAGTNNLFFGADDDLKIYHTGVHAFVENGTGNVYLRSSAGTSINIEPAAGASAIIANAGSDVELYYNNSKKFETDAGGVKITGVCTATSFSGSGSGLTGLNIPAGFNELDAALFN